MSNGSDLGKELLTIKEVVAKTGLPASTIRYYDQQFEDILEVERGAGRRRLFPPQAVERLQDIRRLLKDEGLSLRQARQVLTVGGSPAADEPGPGRVAELETRLAILEDQVRELKDIQRRTLALVDGLTR